MKHDGRSDQEVIDFVGVFVLPQSTRQSVFKQKSSTLQELTIPPQNAENGELSTQSNLLFFSLRKQNLKIIWL
jgi:hypothetical protein